MGRLADQRHAARSVRCSARHAARRSPTTAPSSGPVRALRETGGGEQVQRGPSGGRADSARRHGRTVVAAPAAGCRSDTTCRGAVGCAARPIWRRNPGRGGRGRRERWVLRGLPRPKAAEESGRVRRGYFVEGLGAAQFAVPGAIDRCARKYRTSREATASATRSRRHRSGESIWRGIAVAGPTLRRFTLTNSQRVTGQRRVRQPRLVRQPRRSARPPASAEGRRFGGSR